MIEEIVLRSACLVNENSWSIDNWLTLVSIIITAIFSGMMWYVAKTQKNIQEKQKNLELLKLRLKHKKDFIDILSKLMTKVISVNKKNISEFQINIYNDLSSLMDIISEGKYLFNKEIFENEKDIFNRIRDFCDKLNSNNFKEIESIKNLVSNFMVDIAKLSEQQEIILTNAEIK